MTLYRPVVLLAIAGCAPATHSTPSPPAAALATPSPAPDELYVEGGGGVFDGPYVSFHDNRVPRQIGRYVDGQREGHWRWFDRQGRPVGSGLYRHSEPIGLFYQLGAGGGATFDNVAVDGRGAVTPADRRRLDELAAAIVRGNLVDCGAALWDEGDPPPEFDAVERCDLAMRQAHRPFVAHTAVDAFWCGNCRGSGTLTVSDGTWITVVSYRFGWAVGADDQPSDPWVADALQFQRQWRP